MVWAVHQHSDLFARIDCWKQEVAKNTLQQEFKGQPRLPKYEPYPMKLRSRDTRSALAQVSGNSFGRKRKASTTIADSATTKTDKKARMHENKERDGPMKQQAPRGRGRPRKIVEPAIYGPLSIQIPIGPPPSVWCPSSVTSPQKAPASPNKRGHVTLDKVPSEAAIDMAYLERCIPAVKLTKFKNLLLDGIEISPPVLELHNKLHHVPLGLIPSALETVYEKDADTPRKPKDHYLGAAQTPFPKHCLSRMKSTADDVLEKADRADLARAHEKQWGALVNQLLCEVEIWQDRPKRVVVLNVETCSIQPVEIRPTRPEGTPIDCDAQTNKSDTKTNTTSESMGRMVDWSLAIKVDSSDMTMIREAQAGGDHNACSLNQSLSYIRDNPLIMDLEIKKTIQPRDPRVQLAIWASSALLKKKLHEWNTSMPMPAVTISGHIWEYYIFFDTGKNLMMAGPYPFGTTANSNGIWAIFYRLHIIMEWGMNEYTSWFKANVVGLAPQDRDEEERS